MAVKVQHVVGDDARLHLLLLGLPLRLDALSKLCHAHLVNHRGPAGALDSGTAERRRQRRRQQAAGHTRRAEGRKQAKMYVSSSLQRRVRAAANSIDAKRENAPCCNVCSRTCAARHAANTVPGSGS